MSLTRFHICNSCLNDKQPPKHNCNDCRTYFSEAIEKPLYLCQFCIDKKFIIYEINTNNDINNHKRVTYCHNCSLEEWYRNDIASELFLLINKDVKYKNTDNAKYILYVLIFSLLCTLMVIGKSNYDHTSLI